MSRLRTGLLALTLVTSGACKSAQPKPEAKPTEDPKAGAAVLAQRPALPPLHPFAAPTATPEKLADGTALIVVERPGDPLETVAWVSLRGADADGEKSGLASLTAEMLQSGSAGRSATQIAQEVNALGTELAVEVDRDGQSYGLTVLPSQLSAAVALLSDVALKPDFAPKEFERVKAERLAKLVADLDQPRVLAAETFDAALYGDTPYGRPVHGTEASVKAMKLEDLKKFYGTMGGGDAALVCAGGVPAEQVRALVKSHFGSGPARAATGPAQVPAPAGPRPPVVLVDKAGAPQSVLRYGQPSVPYRSPERIPLKLMNIILGGSFTSRLNQNLREQHGYTYGARSAFAMHREGGAWLAASDVKTDVTGDAIVEMKKEVTGVLEGGLSEDDLKKAKALYISELVDELQASQGTAGLFQELWLTGLPLDELSRTVPTLEKTTAADVKAATGKALDNSKQTLVVVGDAASVKPQLAKAGLPEPQLWTVAGHQARPAQAAPAAGKQPRAEPGTPAAKPPAKGKQPK